MRLVTMRTPSGPRAARVADDRLVLLELPDVVAALAVLADGGRLEETGGHVAAANADLAPVVPRPEKVLCVGLNYETHVRETGREPPSAPTFFAKFSNALTGPYDPIPLPPESDRVDWEVELAVVIGRTVRRCRPETAWDAIAGYTVINDISMRDWQFRTAQFLQGKTWDRATPIGPALVSLDELADPTDLPVRCEVDGVVMQDARTSDLLFGPAELVSYASTIGTLRPGDVIATGTPAGVGYARTPPVFLRPGNVVRTVVVGVGELRNECIAEEIG